MSDLAHLFTSGDPATDCAQVAWTILAESQPRRPTTMIEITDEMVERAARADWERREDEMEPQYTHIMGSYERTAWEDVDPEMQRQVRAAIRRTVEIALYGAPHA